MTYVDPYSIFGGNAIGLDTRTLDEKLVKLYLKLNKIDESIERSDRKLREELDFQRQMFRQYHYQADVLIDIQKRQTEIETKLDLLPIMLLQLNKLIATVECLPPVMGTETAIAFREEKEANLMKTDNST